jgi:hypothetical protein
MRKLLYVPILGYIFYVLFYFKKYGFIYPFTTLSKINYTESKVYFYLLYHGIFIFIALILFLKFF